ncbi:MAG: undecaprenyldiphospho-muramoylpentapeptide beta-N-acetylglucosaminyltransferase [Nitratireductor sp.]|nr:undecaprenyldiphospho-muramoylpentapeptide beta-N-acetylglucosaminyltransferase [Nitratireductor sp.]
MVQQTFLLCAGGTGGHLFPAEALAHELIARGHLVHLATDDRAERFAGSFPATAIHVIPSATIGSKNPVALMRSARQLLAGYLKARKLVDATGPAAAIGFGGYPTLPPMIAARHKGVPTLIHDANAVMGRANRLLAKKAKLVAMGFAGVSSDERMIVTGNPVRPPVLDAARIAYPVRQADEPFNLLVFGGSQGAHFFSQILPQALALMTPPEKAILQVTCQARQEDIERLSGLLSTYGIKAETAPFFSDIPRRIANSHLVVSRGVASTVSELAVIGRPAVLVPFPHALDHDQALNGRAMVEAGGARIIIQSDLSPGKLAGIIKSALKDPRGLALQAENAKKTGIPDAASRLADCVEQVASGKIAAELKELHP